MVWLKVTTDDLELPVAVADSASELAEICGTTRNAIMSTICHARRYGYRSRYVRVYIEEDEYDSKSK